MYAFGLRLTRERDNKMVEILEGNHGSKEHGFTDRYHSGRRIGRTVPEPIPNP